MSHAQGLGTHLEQLVLHVLHGVPDQRPHGLGARVGSLRADLALQPGQHGGGAQVQGERGDQLEQGSEFFDCNDYTNNNNIYSSSRNNSFGIVYSTVLR